MSSTNIDIIIPNFNKGPFIEECIESVLNQSYTSWTLYVIDDFSSDNSREILKKYKNLNNINIILLKKNKGPSFCRNLGIRISSSNYLSFLDSDDIWHKDKLKNQLSFMKNNKYDFTFSDYISFRTKNNKYIKNKKTNLKNKFNYKEFVKNSSINSSTMILTRKIISTKKFKKLKLLEDYLFKCDILKKNIIAFKINESLAFYRILPSNRSSNKMMNLYWLWKINNNFNKLNILENLISILGITINSLKKYGVK